MTRPEKALVDIVAGELSHYHTRNKSEIFLLFMALSQSSQAFQATRRRICICFRKEEGRPVGNSTYLGKKEARLSVSACEG